MPIREDLVVSAAKFLQDPNVAASPVEKRIAFLQAKNLSPEEVSAALARAASEPGPTQQYAPSSAVVQQQPQQYYGQAYPPQYPPHAWQPPPNEVPRRDWRDWFIMATVVSGVSYGLYSLGKRYVYPLVAPPTPERLETDKKSIDEQFERTFVLVEQLAKDTEALKAAEKERTERLDTALNTLETVLGDLKAANRRRDDEAQQLRDRVTTLKESIPVALANQKDTTDQRLREVNAELKSLKTLITQRMNPAATSTSVGSYPRPAASGSSTPAPTEDANGPSSKQASVADEAAPAKPQQDFSFTGSSSSTTFGRSSPFASGSGMGGAKASIPAWQMAMSKGSGGSSSASGAAATNGTEVPATNGP